MDTPIPKLQSKEINGDGRPVNLPGIYTHRDTKKEYITADGDEGVAQADALMSPVWKDAWERTGDVPSRLELLEMRKKQLAKDLAEEASQKEADEAEIETLKKKVTTTKLPAGGETYTPVAA